MLQHKISKLMYIFYHVMQNRKQCYFILNNFKPNKKGVRIHVANILCRIEAVKTNSSRVILGYTFE